jgi:hypothetical protein
MQHDPPDEQWWERPDLTDEAVNGNGGAKGNGQPGQRPGGSSPFPVIPAWDGPTPQTGTPVLPPRPGSQRARPADDPGTARPRSPGPRSDTPDLTDLDQRPAGPRAQQRGSDVRLPPTRPVPQPDRTTEPAADRRSRAPEPLTTGPVRIPTQNVRPAPPPVQRDAVNIAMFGPVHGGKTTFLLGVLNGSPDARTYGTWAAIPPPSSALAEDLYAKARQHAFPDATTSQADETWIIAGTYPPAPPRKGFRLTRGPAPDTGREVQFNLHIVDSPGGHLLAMPAEVIEMLSQADGLVLLFDPMLMMPAEDIFTDGDEAAEPMFNYLQRTLPYLLRRQLDQGGAAKLPHHLAVCVSKFDDTAVYETARRLGLVDREHDGQPTVASGANAHQLFEALCRAAVESNDHRLPALIEQYFMRDRISYHVVSAIGFYMHPTHGFVEHDYNNVDVRGGQPYIRRLAPQQVWEALIGVYESAVAARRK